MRVVVDTGDTEDGFDSAIEALQEGDTVHIWFESGDKKSINGATIISVSSRAHVE